MPFSEGASLSKQLHVRNPLGAHKASMKLGKTSKLDGVTLNFPESSVIWMGYFIVISVVRTRTHGPKMLHAMCLYSEYN